GEPPPPLVVVDQPMSLRHAAKIAFQSLVSTPHPPAPRLSGLASLPPAGQVLKPGFLLGAATASHQVEGGNDNDWSEWEKGSFADGSPHIKHRDVSGAACDSWNRFAEDVALLRELGANAYRLSVEWSRLEPEEGAWNEAVADRYREWMRLLRAQGIQPLVTLNHFTLPRWVAAQGGWMNERIVEWLAAYTRRVARKLGAEVDLWCTLNEPNVLMAHGYMQGTWPPGLQDTQLGLRVLARQIHAHARMARELREHDTVDADGDGHATRVGLAHHVRIFQPATRSPLDRVMVGFTDRLFNQLLVDVHRTGRIQISVPGVADIDEEVPGLKGSYDYLGLNYYSRDMVRADLRSPTLSRQYVAEGRPLNDLGWDVYPEGLYQVLKRYGRAGLPLYVTENGMADNRGERRPGFLREHFEALVRAAHEGVDVRGYFHWSLVDNFEWAEGFEPRFGLYGVDYAHPDKRRRPTPAVATFQELARGLGLHPQPRTP
ncbi:MAG: glycoside hydrolase family 1 protein, partial [Archangium sp.]